MHNCREHLSAELSLRRFIADYIAVSWWYGDSAANTFEEGSSVFSLIRMR